MILKEFEGKQLLSAVGLEIPKSVLVLIDQKNNLEELVTELSFPVFVKAQVLHGNRELQGLVSKVDSPKDLKESVQNIFSKKDQYGQPISHILIEEMVQFKGAMYVGISYSTKLRSVVLQFSKEGGTGMDERGSSVAEVPISVLNGITEFSTEPKLLPVLQKLFEVFKSNDASLVEINPLVETNEGYICLDAKIELEDFAKFRHPEWEQYGERSAIAKPPTAIELKAKEISRSDTRGVAGESFFEFPGGKIGVMASGGGASTLAMDALLSEGLEPANYTEYSGNPTKEKVYALTKLVLKLPHLEGLYVVGSNANFTDIYETLSGVVAGILESEIPKDFKVLIRRGGPRWQEAFVMVEERLSDLIKNHGLRLKLFGPDFSIVKTAKEMKKMFEEV